MRLRFGCNPPPRPRRPSDARPPLRAGKFTPVLYGASLRNVGVQPLMDAVVRYLPSPEQAPRPIAATPAGGATEVEPTDGGDLCALAFKVWARVGRGDPGTTPATNAPRPGRQVQYDPQRGPLVFLRVYSGTLRAKDLVLNTGKNTKERVNRLLQVRLQQQRAPAPLHRHLHPHKLSLLTPVARSCTAAPPPRWATSQPETSPQRSASSQRPRATRCSAPQCPETGALCCPVRHPPCASVRPRRRRRLLTRVPPQASPPPPPCSLRRSSWRARQTRTS